ncbi:murein biosynthesis integral membrane protein MurJ, partial [Candidatus Gribaldobacteria bacterium]|nr:murein biosynthesis integral membrane protein MurJ [Candidatus Gribaldobacteria bacterium]
LRNNFLGNIFPPEKVDVYLASFRVPDLVYGILITGGITAAFLPVFSDYYKENKEKAKELTQNVFSVFVLGLALFSFLLLIFAKPIVSLAFPGFSALQQTETIALMRIMLLSPIILGSSAVISSVLQYFNFFLAYSLAPIFYNLGIILGILFFSKKFGLVGLAYGVVLGAIAHLFIQLPSFFKTGFNLKPKINLKDKGLKKIFQLTLPRAIGSAGYYLNLLIITGLASLLPAGSILAFNFSNDIYGVPMGLIGISFAVAVFPHLSRYSEENEKNNFLKSFKKTFSDILFFALPITFIMFLLRAQLVRLLYGTRIVGTGYFSWDLTRLTAASVGILCFSIFASCLIPFLSRVFYSLKNTKTPVTISLVCVALNLGLSFWFIKILENNNFLTNFLVSFLKLQNLKSVAVLGLPIALSITTILQVILLYLFLQKKIKGLKFSSICPKCYRLVLASFLTALFLFFALRFFDLFLNTAKVWGLFLQVGFASLFSFIFYLFLTWIFKCFKPSRVLTCFKSHLP